jgi:outer membrane protein
MKNTSLVLNIVLFVGVLGLYILYFSGSKTKTTSNAGGGTAADPTDFKIAYIKIDSLVVNYGLAQEIHDGFTRQQDAYTKEYGERRSKFESAAQAFQEKVQRGGFLTQERALQERDRLAGEEQQITRLDQELSAKLAQLQSDNNKQLLDSIMNYIKIYNKDKKYNYIFNATDILIGDENHNITKEVLAGLNARYSKNNPK